MPILNYLKEFAPLVESGEKRQTIRALRKRPFKPDDWLYHYTGLRTKQCRKLLESKCHATHFISIDEKGRVLQGGRLLTNGELMDLAQADGFQAFCEMLEFFRTVHGLPFTGQLIRW